jgi:hypothetical protein
MIRQITIFFISIFLAGVLQAQEIITGLQFNESIRHEIKQKGKPALKQNVHLTLPFFDDFAGDGAFPSSGRWADNHVFINSDYPVFPITTGVATFDAIDENGRLYPNAGDNRFIADYLTSHPIRLDSVFFPEPKALTAADSLILSFYFQPEGLGFPPSQTDSLVLEFFHDHPVDSLKSWVKIWSTPGMTLNAFFALHNSYFKRVAIPITDTAFLKPGFRFRFYNIASIRFPNAPSHQSNRDHWHIDYVYLNYDRSVEEDYHPDIAFANRPGSFLKNYHAMPYRQYRQNFINELGDSIRVRVTNLDNDPVNGSYKYTVKKTGGSHLHSYQTGIFSFLPYSQAGYVSKDSIAWPRINFAFPVNDGLHASYDITHMLESHNGFEPSHNDTVRFRQVFDDYYAYDDGTAEAGWGLTNPGFMACRFKLNTPDTLTRVMIFFNRTLNNANQNFFNLQVWNEFGGQPGELIYDQLNFRVEYDEDLNGFYTYHLNEPVYIDNTQFPGLTFYVGLEQTTTAILNIGFDRNRNSKQNIFYFSNNTWYNTMADGSLMLRPVLGTTGVSGIKPGSAANIPLLVYPNPVSQGTLNLNIEEKWLMQSHYQIMNLTGTILLEGIATRQMNVSNLPSGLYLLRLISGEQTGYARFVVNK